MQTQARVKRRTCLLSFKSQRLSEASVFSGTPIRKHRILNSDINRLGIAFNKIMSLKTMMFHLIAHWHNRPV